MYIRVCPTRETFKKVVNQFRLQIADQTYFYRGINDGGSASRKIHGGQCQRFIHRHQKISGAQNAFLVAQSFGKCLSQRNAHVFDGMVLVHIEVAGGFKLQIKSPMMGKQLQHVVKKTNAGRNFVFAVPIHGQCEADLRLFGVSLQGGFSHFTAFSRMPSCSNTTCRPTNSCSFCAAVPTVMRTQSLQPGSAERSRTKMLRSRIRRMKSAFLSPRYINTKFARLGQ